MTKLERMTRKERRKQAREQGTKFQPQYNGKAPITFGEYVEGFGTNPITGKSLLPSRLRKSPLNKAEVVD